ncbi:MAG: DUF4199 domain-containing protein [Crocinitomicaceae bacterium]|jgi:hypothetical protein|tara:strand:- start:4105 stop:4647 length:543 start_codon:yes stop_codon:yes gene_type:complete
MKTPIKIGVGFALLWIILKLSAFSFNVFLTDLKPFVFANMLFVTLAISIALYAKKRQQPGSNLLEDVKTAMIPGVLYAVIVSSFIYFYYQSIYPEFNSSKITEIELRMNDEVAVADFRKSNPGMENSSSDEIREKVMDSMNNYYSAQFTMTVSLLGLLLYATLNSLVLSLIFRRVIFRNV